MQDLQVEAQKPETIRWQKPTEAGFGPISFAVDEHTHGRIRAFFQILEPPPWIRTTAYCVEGRQLALDASTVEFFQEVIVHSKKSVGRHDTANFQAGFPASLRAFRHPGGDSLNDD